MGDTKISYDGKFGFHAFKCEICTTFMMFTK